MVAQTARRTLDDSPGSSFHTFNLIGIHIEHKYKINASTYIRDGYQRKNTQNKTDYTFMMGNYEKELRKKEQPA